MTRHDRLSAEEIESLADDIAEAAAHVDAATHRMLSKLRAFEEAEGWSETGALSLARWLSWRVGMSLGVAREKCRVAHALGSLPEIDEAFRVGRLSYSKVRAMTRVATAENEELLLGYGLAATAAQLEKICRLYRPIQQGAEGLEAEDERRWLRVRNADDGMVRITVSLRPDEAARVLAAVDACAELREGERTRVDGLVALADRVTEVSAETPAQSGERLPVEAVVRVEVDAATGIGVLPDGTGVSAETSRRLLCDAGIVALAEDERGNPLSLGRRRRVVSTALRRALEARDGGCRFPGCTNHRHTDAHHIEHWAEGGETSLDNTILLCPRHHTFVHEHGFTVERDGDGLPVFRDSRGNVVPPSGERALRRAATLERVRRALAEEGVFVDATTNQPTWDGSRPDFGLCIEFLSHADGLDRETDRGSGPT